MEKRAASKSFPKMTLTQAVPVCLIPMTKVFCICSLHPDFEPTPVVVTLEISAAADEQSIVSIPD
jgi:hypothetical protein